MDEGEGKCSSRYEVKDSPNTKIYKLKEIFKNSMNESIKFDNNIIFRRKS